MSRLAKNIIASETGQRFTDVTPMPTLTVKDDVVGAPGGIAYEYRLDVRLGTSVFVNKSSAGSSAFSSPLRAARRKIIEDVFGEFRPLIYQINEAIHNRNWVEANRLTEKLYQQMFEDGL